MILNSVRYIEEFFVFVLSLDSKKSVFLDSRFQ